MNIISRYDHGLYIVLINLWVVAHRVVEITIAFALFVGVSFFAVGSFGRSSFVFGATIARSDVTVRHHKL